jgi:two-component system sensor histidine kinase DctS
MRADRWLWGWALAGVATAPLPVCAAADLPLDKDAACARTFITEWKQLTPVQRNNGADRHRLRQQMQACLGDRPDGVEAYLLRTDDGGREMTLLGEPPSAERLYPAGPGHVLVLEQRATTAVAAVAGRSPWWLSVLALGLVGVVIAGLRWLGRTQRDHQHTLQAEAALRLDIEASIHVGLCVIRHDGRLHHVNRAFCEISGWSPPELTGEPTGGQAPPYPFWPRDQVARLDDDLRKILAAEVGVDRYRETYVRPDGTLWTAQLSAHRLHSGEGWLFTSVDVSSEVAAQERIDALDAQWRDARPVQAMGLHSGDLLHKISNYSGAYRAAIDGLARHLKAGRHDALGEGVRIAERAAQRMDAIVEQYRTTLRNKVTKEPTSLYNTVTDAMVQVRSHAAQHNVAMDNTVSEALPLILVERGMLCDVLVNLLNNAISVMEKTSVLNRRISVSHYIDDDSGQVQLHVCDRGPGVPSALRDTVFTHGYSTRKGGHGWGLYASRLWATDVGGSLTVQDHLPRGADFVLTLPLNPVVPAEPTEEPPHAPASPTPPAAPAA